MLNRRLEIRAVKDDAPRSDISSRPLFNSDEYAEFCTITAYWSKRAAMGFVAVYTTVVAVNTVSKIAIKKL